MPKHVIAIDFDDVLVQTAPLALEYYNQNFGTSMQLSDNYSNDLKKWNASSYDEVVTRIELFENSNSFCDAVLPVQGAIEAMTILSEIFDIHIVTSRSPYLEDATLSLIDKHYKGLIAKLHLVGISGNKSTSKAEVCQQINARVLLDDSLYHIVDALDNKLDVILFGDYPWNSITNIPVPVVKADTWPDVIEIMREYK